MKPNVYLNGKEAVGVLHLAKPVEKDRQVVMIIQLVNVHLFLFVSINLKTIIYFCQLQKQIISKRF